MYRARSLVSAIVTTAATAAALAGVTWFGAVLAARGTSQAILPTLLTTNNFAALEWPYRTDGPPPAVHVAFYVTVGLVALIAGAVTLLVARKASPRNGAAALAGSWLGVVLGSLVAAVAIYYIRLDALAPTAADRNAVLASLLRDFAFGGLLLGVVPALLSWAAFKLVNRSRAAQYAEAMDHAEGRDIDENPFDLAPGSNGDTRPVEPGFTYPAGDNFHDGSYKDADLPPSERRTRSMTFSDVTDATGEDFIDRGGDETHRQRAQEQADLSFAAPASESSGPLEGPEPAPDGARDVDEHAAGGHPDADGPRWQSADYGLDGGTASTARSELRKTGT